ncbi:helix-turn-helix transcriptional regulator [Motilimonas pumila]|uniref:AraC family transcriptional regulator n=1 Tax=Motilimonas pumila TaxID=2303987 RepID=A0A418YE23_9GAMM|nr:AraC family transcriptional regulator [Motilimonas pumila]RJG42771.1 AraC family transcriptional regulator [Motilimonas pumila]
MEVATQMNNIERQSRTEEISQQTDLFDYSLWTLAAGESLNCTFTASFNLFLVINGEVNLTSPYGDDVIAAGTLVTLDGANFTATNLTPATDSVVLALSCNDKMLQRFKNRYADALINAQQKRLTETLPLPLRFEGCDLTRMAMTGFAQLLQNQTAESLMGLKLEELLLLQLTEQGGSELADQLLSACDPATARFREFVEANFLNDWSLELFAKEYAVSLTAFKSLFNQVYNQSPRAWINERRLRYADELLRTNSMRIIDIAVTAGFSSQSYFTQAYKARFGITPTKVRQAMS